MSQEALAKVEKFHNSETEVLFDTRSAKVTDVSRSSSLIGTEEDPVQSSMEAAQGNPLHHNSDKTRSSCIDLRVQGESDEWTDDEHQKKRSLIQFFSPQTRTNWWQNFQKATTRRTKIFLRKPRTLSKHKEFSKLLKFLWSQTQHSAGCVTNTPMLDTHIAIVDVFFLEHVKKLRSKFSKTSSILSLNSQQAHLFSNLENPVGKHVVAAKPSHLYHKAREHHKKRNEQ